MSENLKLMRDAVRASQSSIDFGRAALLVIDMQKYQVRNGSILSLYGMISPTIPDYYLSRVRDIVEPNIVRILQKFRSQGSLIIFTKFASTEKDESDLAEYCKEGNRVAKEITGGALIPQVDDPMASVVESLAPLKNEIILQKSRSGAFINTPLDSLLRQSGIEQIVIVGVLTHACVENTARVGVDLGYEVFVVEDACATLDPNLHENSIAAMEVLSANIMTVQLALDSRNESS